jgi:hypothetical protein
MQICVEDLNGDGRPVIAVSGKTGTWLLINEGKKKWKSKRILTYKIKQV